MKKPLVIKDLTMVAVLSAILVVVNNFYLLLMPFLFVVYILALKKWHVYMISIITSMIIFLIGTATGGPLNFPSLSNLVFLPLTAFIIYALYPRIYVETLDDSGCMTAPRKINKWVLTIASLLLFMVNGAVSQAIYEFISVGHLVFEPLGWAIGLGLPIINAVVIYFLAFPLRNRICKLLYYVGI